MSVIEILETGRDVLLNDGWCQRALKNDEGEHCALGAVIEAGQPGYFGAGFIERSIFFTFDDDVQQAVALLASQIPTAHRAESDWNRVALYNNGNGWIDVLAMFDGAIADAQAGHFPTPRPIAPYCGTYVDPMADFNKTFGTFLEGISDTVASLTKIDVSTWMLPELETTK